VVETNRRIYLNVSRGRDSSTDMSGQFSLFICVLVMSVESYKSDDMLIRPKNLLGKLGPLEICLVWL